MTFTFCLSACSGTSPGVFGPTYVDAGGPSVNNGDGGNLFNGPEASTTPLGAVCDPAAPCLQSQETDATGAAVVWHQQMQYWTVNVAGCIARATGDATAAGCGASYAAAISCRQSSCNACWQAQGQSATFQQFSDCETMAGSTTCQTYAEAVPAKCGNLDTPPASVCMPNSGATAQEAYMQIAQLFCGQ